VNLPLVAETILRSRADVVALQETNEESEAYLRDTLSMFYPNMIFKGWKGYHASERVGFLSKAPFVHVEFIPPKAGLFGSLIARVSWGRTYVRIANVHLQPPPIARMNNINGILKVFKVLRDTHQKEMAAILSILRRDKAAIIMGDFNSTSLDAASILVKKSSFVDSFAAVTVEADGHPTWHWRMFFGEIALRIDYIFHSKEFETISSKVLPSDASDHYLVLSRLRLIN
jgi:endonuclease/exonuclease/phosphatase family metal-dependent hydrolase